MRQLRIVCVGKIKSAHRYIQEALQLYETRLRPVFKVEWVEVAEAKSSESKTLHQIMEEEAVNIERMLLPNAQVVLLSERGDALDSAAFSSWLFDEIPPNGGHKGGASAPIIFIIGGASGTADRLQQLAHRKLALSRLTFPHQLVRVILLEQCYRAWMISQGKPYHK